MKQDIRNVTENYNNLCRQFEDALEEKVRLEIRIREEAKTHTSCKSYEHVTDVNPLQSQQFASKVANETTRVKNGKNKISHSTKSITEIKDVRPVQSPYQSSSEVSPYQAEKAKENGGYNSASFSQNKVFQNNGHQEVRGVKTTPWVPNIEDKTVNTNVKIKEQGSLVSGVRSISYSETPQSQELIYARQHRYLYMLKKTVNSISKLLFGISIFSF